MFDFIKRNKSRQVFCFDDISNLLGKYRDERRYAEKIIIEMEKNGDNCNYYLETSGRKIVGYICEWKQVTPAISREYPGNISHETLHNSENSVYEVCGKEPTKNYYGK